MRTGIRNPVKVEKYGLCINPEKTCWVCKEARDEQFGLHQNGLPEPGRGRKPDWNKMWDEEHDLIYLNTTDGRSGFAMAIHLWKEGSPRGAKRPTNSRCMGSVLSSKGGGDSGTQKGQRRGHKR